GSSALPAPGARSLISLAEVRPESERIEFLLRRDGHEATRKWVERTLGLYRAEIGRRGSYATDATYRPRFEKAIREFEEWLVAPGR
ncbi:MAG TPA: hypothetical protein VN691_00545, partial [Steroidobacteraceae bacterium]|nr:hypothetical protein [Steroidobacteraceae bacterium]